MYSHSSVERQSPPQVLEQPCLARLEPLPDLPQADERPRLRGAHPPVVAHGLDHERRVRELGSQDLVEDPRAALRDPGELVRDLARRPRRGSISTSASASTRRPPRSGSERERLVKDLLQRAALLRKEVPGRPCRVDLARRGARAVPRWGAQVHVGGEERVEALFALEDSRERWVARAEEVVEALREDDGGACVSA